MASPDARIAKPTTEQPTTKYNCVGSDFGRNFIAPKPTKRRGKGTKAAEEGGGRAEEAKRKNAGSGRERSGRERMADDDMEGGGGGARPKAEDADAERTRGGGTELGQNGILEENGSI